MFILTVMVYWAVGQGPIAFSTSEYNSAGACEAARKIAVQTFTVDQRKAVGACTAKG